MEYALTLVTAFYTDGLLRPIDDLTSEEKAEVDQMNGEFVTEFSEPLSRILARNTLSKKYGRQVVDSYDWLAVVIAVWGYHRDLDEIRTRRKQAIERKRLTVQGAMPNVPTDTPFAQGGEPLPGNFNGIAVPPGALG